MPSGVGAGRSHEKKSAAATAAAAAAIKPTANASVDLAGLLSARSNLRKTQPLDRPPATQVAAGLVALGIDPRTGVGAERRGR